MLALYPFSLSLTPLPSTLNDSLCQFSMIVIIEISVRISDRGNTANYGVDGAV